jgi:hypothetical protein
MSAQHLRVQPRRGVDGVEGIGVPGAADARGGGVELGADLLQAPSKFARSRSPVAPVVHAEVDVLGLAVSEAAQTSGAVGEEFAEDLAVPGAQQRGGELDRAGGGERAEADEQLGEPVDADVPRLLRGESGRAEKRRLHVVAESPERCAVGRAHG